MWPRLLQRQCCSLKHPFSWIDAFGKRWFGSSPLSLLELDLYHDVVPFDGVVPDEVLSFPQTNDRHESIGTGDLPPMLNTTQERLNRSDITQSFFLVNKKHGELLDELTLTLSKAFNAKNFYIASSGSLDVLASGVVLLCCGKSMDAIDHFDGLPHTYRGIMRIGQTTASYDLKSHVDARHHWKHIKDREMEDAAQSLVGDLLIPPPPIAAVRSRREGGYYILRQIEDQSERPCTVHSFRVSRTAPTSPEVRFELDSDAVLHPQSLANAFGLRLGCGAFLYELHRSAIGKYTSDEAWASDEIRKSFAEAECDVTHFPERAVEAALKLSGLRHAERVSGCNWHRVLIAKRRVKTKPYELRLRRQHRLQMEAEGLISDEEIMKRKLKKKAVKLVANLNVPEIEKVFTKIQEE